MGFLLDWLHFPTLEWYRSASRLSTLLDRSVSDLLSLSLHSGKLSRVSLLQGVEVNCDSKIVQFISFVRRSWHGLLKHGPQDKEKSRILCVGTRHSKSRGQSHLLLGDPEEREGGDQGGDIYYGKSFQFITSEKRKEEALSRRILYIRLDGV